MKKIPLRKCLATAEQLPKKELIRIVRDKDGNVTVDVTGRANGRGAYLKKSLEAVDIAQKRHAIDRALDVKVTDEIFDELRKLISNE